MPPRRRRGAEPAVRGDSSAGNPARSRRDGDPADDRRQAGPAQTASLVTAVGESLAGRLRGWYPGPLGRGGSRRVRGSCRGQRGAAAGAVSVKGWAIDASAPSGTGVNLVRVRAARNYGSGQPLTNYGDATYGAKRPAVVATHGTRFRYSGYTGTFTLPSGQLYLQVLARSSHTQVWTTRTRTIYVDMATVPLTIDRPGTGTGSVTASGLSCPGGSTTQALPCGASYALHAARTLTAVPDPGSTFAGWGGACSGTGTCQVTMSMARYVTASFTK